MACLLWTLWDLCFLHLLSSSHCFEHVTNFLEYPPQFITGSKYTLQRGKFPWKGCRKRSEAITGNAWKWCHTLILMLLPSPAFFSRWPCKPIETLPLHTSQILAVRYWESLWWKKDWTNASTWWKQRCQEPVKQQTHIKNCKNALQKMAKHRCCWTPLDKWNSYSGPLQPCPAHSSWARLCGVVAVE